MRKLCLTACLSLIAASLFGQSDRGAITGTVSDPTGAVIAGASVEAQNVDNGAVYQAGTSATGNYTLGQLPTGNYKLTAQAARFKSFQQQNIFLPVAQTLRLDVTLQIGAAADSVTVTDEASLLKTETAEVAHNITTERVVNLPAFPIGTGSGARNPLAITRLVQGSFYAPDQSLRINGLPANTQSFRVDGQEIQNGIQSTNQSWTQPSVDAIQEVAVQTSTYAAEFGQAGGGVFNATMKSGTNQYHGSAYDYMRNEAFNAGMPNTVQPGSPNEHRRNVVRQHDYGFAFGGPVRIPKLYDGHDKTFFFFNFEQFRESTVTSTALRTVPIAPYRQGNFMQALGIPLGTDKVGQTIFQNQLFDPNSESLVQAPPPSLSCLTCTGQLERVRRPFAVNNVVPLTYFDPVAIAVQEYMPDPDRSSLQNNYNPVFPNSQYQTIPSFKIDQNLTDRMKLSGYYGITSYQKTNDDGMPYPITSARANDVFTQTLRINYDYTIGPTLLLHVGAGLVNTLNADKLQEFDVTSLGNDGKGLQGTGGAPYMFYVPTSNIFGGVFGGYSQQIGPFTAFRLVNQKPSGLVSLSWVRGNHSYKFGGEIIFDSYQNTSNTFASPLINFSPTNVTTPSVLGVLPTMGPLISGFGYASFLMGRADSGTTAVTNVTDLSKHAIVGYVQDSWKVTRRFTVDYGLRYDFQTYLKERSGNYPNLGPTTPNPTTDGLPGAVIFEGYGSGQCQCNFARNYPWAFGPRFGAAYQLNSKTVLRGGFGVSYARTGANNGLYLAFTGGVPYSSAQFGDPAYTLANGLPYQVTFPNLDPGQLPYQGIPAPGPAYFDQNAGRPGRTMQWSFMVQREIMRDLTVEAGYVGNRGAWFPSSGGVCDLCLQSSSLAKQGIDVTSRTGQILLSSPLNSPAAMLAGFSTPPYSKFPLTKTVREALTAFPMYTSIQRLWAPLGTTWYDSLQANVTKRFSYGLDLQANFTWSRQLMNSAETEGSLIQPVTPQINDVFNRAQNKYLSGYDQPFLFVLSGSYITPRWNVNKWVASIVGGWQLSFLARYASGTPIRVPTSINGNSAYLNRPTFVNAVPGQPIYLKDPNCKCFDPSKELILNPAAWSEPAAGTFGTAAAYYTSYRNPRRPDENVGFARNFRFGEGRMNLQVRAEFANIFNRWTWPAPTGASLAIPTSKDPVTGALTGGFGFVDIRNGLAAQPRSGALVGRFTF